MQTDDTDMVSLKMGEKIEPVLIDGKRLVLPTQEHLNNAFATSKVIFHPLNENIIRGESEVINKLRTSFKIKFNITTAVLGQTLLKICASIAEHKHLNPEQSEMLSEIKDVDDNTFTTFGKIMVAAMKANADKAFVNVFLKSGAKLADRKYSRAGIVSFPMYEELIKGADHVFGVKLRVKDRKAYIQLFEYMYTHIQEPQLYNIGSNSQIAPFLEALLNTCAQLAENLNRVINLFKDKIDDPEALLFNSDWMDGFDKLEDLLPQIRNIPNQEPTNKPAQPQAQQSPVAYATQAPQQQPMMQQVPMQQPQPMYAPQQPQQPQQPGLVKTENGLDFRSVLRNNNAVAQTVMNNPMSMSTMPMNPMMYPNPMQQQMMQQPRWAQPQPQQMMPQQQMPMQQYPQQMPMQQPMQPWQQQQMMPQQQMPMQQMPQQYVQPGMMQQPMQQPMQMMPMQQPMQPWQQQQMMPQQQWQQQPTFMNR